MTPDDPSVARHPRATVPVVYAALIAANLVVWILYELPNLGSAVPDVAYPNGPRTRRADGTGTGDSGTVRRLARHVLLDGHRLVMDGDLAIARRGRGGPRPGGSLVARDACAAGPWI